MQGKEVVDTMMKQDWFSQWLGIDIISIEPGKCRLKMQVRKEMLNGFGIAHGGITYSVADSALAFASNSKGRKSLSIETSISHIVSLKESDILVAEGVCETESEKLGHYTVKLYLENQPEKAVALFRGIVYKTSK